jgi:hypothetical protein
MKLDYLLYFFLLAASLFLFLRTIINWQLINLIEGTCHPKIFGAGPMDLFLTVRHYLRSAIKFWWKGNDFKAWKVFSNIISSLFYLSLLGWFATFIVGYKL